jgi:Prokaryotic lipoprotein-attachment site
MRLPALTLLLLALAACGQRTDLKPLANQSLPVAPYGREDRPDADALLDTTPQAEPERSVELRKRSEERTLDPFDLPPSD